MMRKALAIFLCIQAAAVQAVEFNIEKLFPIVFGLWASEAPTWGGVGKRIAIGTTATVGYHVGREWYFRTYRCVTYTIRAQHASIGCYRPHQLPDLQDLQDVIRRAAKKANLTCPRVRLAYEGPDRLLKIEILCAPKKQHAMKMLALIYVELTRLGFSNIQIS